MDVAPVIGDISGPVVDQTAKLILHIIPVFGVWFTPGRNHRPATGFLEERIRNIRKRLRSQQEPRPQREVENEPSRAVIPVSTISAERAEQLKEWLRYNAQPINQVELLMLETAVHRAQWIRENTTKSIQEALIEFPRLTMPGTIAQDFMVLHGEVAPKLFGTWVSNLAEKVLTMAKMEGKFPVQTEELTQDAKGELALRLLPILLPPKVYKIGRKVFRPSIHEAKKAFIDVQPVSMDCLRII
ncbi:hypothetical protein SKAU_G00210690 [Synaphobranchus kaupii]|uniref:Uncharacterized protein n=1 Tax=Synaphobranchus kaupii TaxID=118154 RepID=A0A9Q1F914_SYNKA|nr:hypothetical protein SKAU_G00210690 [Synaphobranchus kaupii]